MLAFWRLRHIKTKSLNWVKWSILSTLTSRGSTQCTQCIQHNLVWSFGQSGNSWTTQLGTARHRVLPHGTEHGFFHRAHGTAHGLTGSMARLGTARRHRYGTRQLRRGHRGENTHSSDNFLWTTWCEHEVTSNSQVCKEFSTSILRDQFVLLHFLRVFFGEKCSKQNVG